MKATVVFIIINVIAFITIPNIARYGVVVINGNPLALWRVFTYAFVHSGIIHLMYNLIFGSIAIWYLEHTKGTLHTTLIFAISYIISGLVFSYTIQGTMLMVGASGGIYGVMGAIFISELVDRHSFIILFGITVAIIFGSYGVQAHYIGLATGIIFQLGGYYGNQDWTRQLGFKKVS